MDKLNLIKKELGAAKGTRWFVETNDGFDGTAQGYGYKTPQAVYKAYAYFKSKDQREAKTAKIKQFLKDNPDVQGELDNYLDLDCMFYRMKDGEPTSIEDMLECIEEDKPEVTRKLRDNKDLWKAIIKHELDKH